MRTKVVNLFDAGNLLRSPVLEGKFTALISIGDPLQSFPLGWATVPKRLRLEFHDVCELLLGDPSSAHEVVPQAEHVQKIIDFGKEIQHQEGVCLIHCHAGMSRSPAAAFILHCLWKGPSKEEEAMRDALAGCREHWIFPNDIMVSHADDILNRNGAMIRELHLESSRNPRLY